MPCHCLIEKLSKFCGGTHYDQDRSDRTRLQQTTEMSKKSAELAVNAAFDALSKAMAEGEKITISGFGTFEIRERAERQGINPRTREPITIAASKSIVFKPGKALKDTL